jgi:hypothetical protein
LQWVDPRQSAFSEALRRSAHGLVGVYNLLPEVLVASPTIHTFQQKLQHFVKTLAIEGDERWHQALSPHVPLWQHPLR